MAILEITDNNFENETSSGLVIVDFWAPWCAPCRAVAPVLEALSSEFEGQVKVTKVNVDENPKSAQQFGVTSIPTVIFLKDGGLTETVVGAQPKPRYEELINKHLG